jgi:prenylcysteine oxidase/farnesylcysteine lyase
LQLSKQGSLWNVTYQSNNDDTNTHSELFDHVVLASPFNQTSIAFDDSISIPREVEYRELYVTFIQTNRTQQLNHAIFKHYSIPEQILTTSPTDSIPFFSINLVDYDKESDKIIYKIFSPIPIDYQYLENFLFDEKQTDWNHVKIIFSKLWKPYPHLIPISTFDDFLIGENFWYLNTIESFISTMETAAFAGANVAGLISIGQNTTDIKL